jgi:hypothetical protein
MLEANPALTPNLVKALLHYTAETNAKAPLSAQGAGMLNPRGAVQLAAALRGDPATITDSTRWSRHVLWGNQRLRGGQITMTANAWRQDVTWGANKTNQGETIILGTAGDTAAPWAVREGGADLPAGMDLEDGLSVGDWPGELRDYIWAAGEAHAPPVLARSAIVMVSHDRRSWRRRAEWTRP